MQPARREHGDAGGDGQNRTLRAQRRTEAQADQTDEENAQQHGDPVIASGENVVTVRRVGAPMARNEQQAKTERHAADSGEGDHGEIAGVMADDRDPQEVLAAMHQRFEANEPQRDQDAQ